MYGSFFVIPLKLLRLKFPPKWQRHRLRSVVFSQTQAAGIHAFVPSGMAWISDLYWLVSGQEVFHILHNYNKEKHVINELLQKWVLRGHCLMLIRIKFVKTQDKFSSSHYPPPRRIVALSIRWQGFGSPDTFLSQRSRSLGSEVNDTSVFDVFWRGFNL